MRESEYTFARQKITTKVIHTNNYSSFAAKHQGFCAKLVQEWFQMRFQVDEQLRFEDLVEDWIEDNEE